MSKIVGLNAREILDSRGNPTLAETFAAIDTAHDAGMKTIVSHRSGDTADDFIADLAVAVGASQFKCGAPRGAERTAKYNRLLEISALN